MIQWNKPDQAPPIDKEDKWNEENKVSPRLLVHIISKMTSSKHTSFGTYFHKSGNWSLDGFRGDFTVLGWTEINEPSTAEKKDTSTGILDSDDEGYANSIRSVLGDNDL